MVRLLIWHLNGKFCLVIIEKIVFLKWLTTKNKTYLNMSIVIEYICLDREKYSELFVRIIEKENNKIRIWKCNNMKEN